MAQLPDDVGQTDVSRSSQSKDCSGEVISLSG